MPQYLVTQDVGKVDQGQMGKGHIYGIGRHGTFLWVLSQTSNLCLAWIKYKQIPKIYAQLCSKF